MSGHVMLASAPRLGLMPDPRQPPLEQLVECLYCVGVHGVNVRCAQLKVVWNG